MSIWKELTNKLSHFRGRPQFDDSMDEEIRLHLENRADELTAAGMSRRDALTLARREFGPTARIAEDSREAWRWTWLEDLSRDLRHGIRALLRDRGFALTAILSLALGIGFNTTIFSLTAEFLFSEPSVRDAGSMVTASVGGWNSIPMQEYRFLRDAKVFDGLAGANPMQEVNWRNGDTTLRLFVTRVTDNFFQVTGVPVALGRPIAEKERGVVVISHRFWVSRMSQDLAVLGKTLRLDGQAHTIVGVLPAKHRTLTGFGYMPDLYMPVENENSRVGLYGRMPSGFTRSAIVDRLRSATVQLDRAYPDPSYKRATYVLVMGLVGVERLTQGFLPSIAAFFALLVAVVGLLLVIACANVASLLLARASTRAHEFAVRMSIGAGRGRLIRQLLAESLLLSILGTAAGLALNVALTRYLNGLVLPMPFPLQLSMQMDQRLLIYAAIVAIVSAVLAGLLPALKSTRGGTSALLKREEHQVSGRRATLRNALVAGQLGVSVLVLILAALSVRNLIQSATLNPGFDLRRTVWAQMRLVPEGYPNYARVRAVAATTLDQLNALPGVESASIAAFVPLNDHFASRTSRLFVEGAEDGVKLEHSWNAVGPDYLSTMGIGLVAGREFTRLDREGAQRVMVINESLARRLFDGANPLGRRIRIGRDDQFERTIVGVARNSKYSTIGERDRPAIYEPWLQLGGNRTTLNYLVKTAGPPDASIKPLTAALLAVDSAAAIEAKPMSDATGFALLPSRMGAALLGSIGMLGLALASVGLYGVLAYSIGRRTREIGLRRALGAHRSDILRLVGRESVWILGIGLGTGMFVAIFITRPLARFLVPGLTTADPLTYLAVAVLLIVVAGAATLTPTLRALRVDPMTALRQD